MIRIQKRRTPDFFESKEMRDVIAAFERRQMADMSVRRQSRAPARFPNLQELKGALLEESHSKCAYCEQKLTASRPLQVDHYRPARGAIDVRGERSEDHYFWLAYDWENLYACCPECNQAKGAKFPVASARVPLGVRGDLDAIEHPMILNPGRSNPEEHLQFHYDGQVTSKTTVGQYTIDVLRLNRASLIEARSVHVKKLETSSDLRNDCSDAAEFAGLSRQVVQAYPTRFQRPTGLLQFPVESASHDSPQPTSQQEQNSESGPISQKEEEERRYYASFPLISSIQIHGLCGLSTVELSVPLTRTELPACLALIGENGVGKSSILKCLALALYDRDALEKLDVDIASMLNADESEGYVRVKFDTQVVSEIRINRNGLDFGNTDPVPILLLAYGPTRLLPTSRNQRVPESEMSQARNLFDPLVPLRDPTHWLKSLNERKFDYAAAAIKTMLQLPDDYKLHRTDDSQAPISLEMFGKHQPLEQLSHGYKSVLALVCDVMATLFTRWQSIDAAQGIVLIDELENHLHPAWKLRIVASLRNAFPRVQFIVTTHDPLCLRGFEAGEVALLQRRTDEEIGGVTIAQASLPAVSDMRIDQILTSAYFGLRSTVDPAVEQLFMEYNSLLEREYALNNDEREQLTRLKAEVAKHDMPGLLPRDRVMYVARSCKLIRQRS